MNATTLLATAGFMLAGSVATADYIQFSQYDGRSTFNNFRVDVDDAFSYKQQGAIYFRGTDRGAMAGTPPTNKVSWVSGEITKTFPSSTNTGTLLVRYYKASPDSDFYDREYRAIYDGTDVNPDTGEIAGPLQRVVHVANRVMNPTLSTQTSWGNAMQTSSVYVPGTDAIPATKGTPSRDAEDTETHLVVPVPTDAVMEDFIYDYLNATGEE